MLRRIFLESGEQRLRAGWRVLVTYAIALGLFAPVQLMLRAVIPPDASREQRVDYTLFAFACVATVAILIARRWIDRRPVRSLGFSGGWRAPIDALAGLLITAAMVGTIVVIGLTSGWMQYAAEQPTAAEVASKGAHVLFFSGLTVSWWENLFFVSYLYLNLRDGLGARTAVGLNLLIFGVAHMINPHAGLAAFVGVVLIHSYELFGFVRMGNLWLIFGIHAGWNFSQALFGFPVSGRQDVLVLSLTNNAPEWFGGNAFGPESGAVILLTTALAYLSIEGYARLAGVHQPGWTTSLAHPSPTERSTRHQQDALGPPNGGAARTRE